MFKMTINGVTHMVTNVDGETIYDPPLPPERIAKGKKNIKDICDSQKFPGLRTDTSFHTGRGTLLDQLDGDELAAKKVTDAAKKRGYTPGANDVYISQLADKMGDPKAFFKPSEGRAELKKRLEQSGKGVDMPGLKVESKMPDERKRPALNPRLAKQMAREYRSSGEHSSMSDKELLSHVVKKHGRAVE